MNNRNNYLEIHVGINTKAQWFLELQKKMKKINVGCKKSRFHITAMFMHDDTQKDKLKNALSGLLSHGHAPLLTFNKLDVFTNKSGNEHIVNLTSTRPETEFQEFVDSLRQEAYLLGIEMEPYRLHVTLAKVPSRILSLDEVKKIIDDIKVREFKLVLNTLEYRYKNTDLKEGLIERWKLDETNKTHYKNN